MVWGIRRVGCCLVEWLDSVLEEWEMGEIFSFFSRLSYPSRSGPYKGKRHKWKWHKPGKLFSKQNEIKTRTKACGSFFLLFIPHPLDPTPTPEWGRPARTWMLDLHLPWTLSPSALPWSPPKHADTSARCWPEHRSARTGAEESYQVNPDSRGHLGRLFTANLTCKHCPIFLQSVHVGRLVWLWKVRFPSEPSMQCVKCLKKNDC